MNETIDSVLTFWFGNCPTTADINNDRKELWWGKNETIDQEIDQRFRELVNMVAKAKLDHWCESPKGLLAGILCTDQFPRNIYRDTGKAFSFDDVALRLAQQAIAMRADQELLTIQRVFVYLPYEHSEELLHQEQSLKLFQQLLEDAEDSDKDIFRGFLNFANRHHEIIVRFGRFPHRNKLLGRASTEEELVFLTEPGSSF